MTKNYETDGEYPPLPDHQHTGCGPHFTRYWSACAMRAYVDADRAMRAHAAPANDARKLATAIAEAATRAGITDASKHSFSGPQLLMLLDDMADMIERAQAAPAAVALPEVLCWVPEDELPESTTSEAYDALFPYSRVDVIRLFPVFGPSAPTTQATPVAQGDAELPALFREALAWGMTYGPGIPAHQWDEMRESMVKHYTARAAK